MPIDSCQNKKPVTSATWPYRGLRYSLWGCLLDKVVAQDGDPKKIHMPIWVNLCMQFTSLQYGKSISWSIDSCQNKVSADQFQMTVSRARVWNSTEVACFFFFKFTSDQVIVTQWGLWKRVGIRSMRRPSMKQQSGITIWWNKLRSFEIFKMTISLMSRFAVRLGKISFAVHSEFCRLDLQLVTVVCLFVCFLSIRSLAESVHKTDSPACFTLALLTYFLSRYTALWSLLASWDYTAFCRKAT